MDVSPYIFKTQKFSIHDGPGIRTTLFFKGCPLSCAWCHNPESQAMPDPLKIVDLEAVTKLLMADIEKDRIFYDESGGGVTFSGGEPLCQPDLLFSLADRCRQQGIHTCLDTCGAAPWDILETACRKVDLILYDIKLIGNTDHRALTGRGNKVVLENLVRLSEQKIPVLLRFPLIPGMTDTKQNIDGLISFVKENTMYRNIHILPFHKAGEKKYETLGMENTLEEILVPSKEQVAQAVSIFESKGFNVTIGG